MNIIVNTFFTLIVHYSSFLIIYLEPEQHWEDHTAENIDNFVNIVDIVVNKIEDIVLNQKLQKTAFSHWSTAGLL